MNMAHWDFKYVWYVYYASTNTGAERGRKEAKESGRQGKYCVFLIEQVLGIKEEDFLAQ